jgi:hypothetical protein
MHRPSIGFITIVLLAAGLLMRSSSDETVSSACLRVGLLMGILWLAHPQLERAPRWLVLVGCGAMFVVMRWPRLLVLALPVAIALWLLKPRGRPTGPT